MIADQMRKLFDYNYWAWRRVFASIKKLDPADYMAVRPVFNQDDSLHRLLVHSLAAESIWLARCHGHSPNALLDLADFPDFPAVEELWATVEDDWQNFLRGLNDTDLVRPVEYRNTRGNGFTLTLVDIVQHVANHATEHRSQITPILFQLGQPTQPLDFMLFCLRS
jgi:uncharacterized damage-inducible protein DinB